jgi:hypothetical protein
MAETKKDALVTFDAFVELARQVRKAVDVSDCHSACNFDCRGIGVQI